MQWGGVLFVMQLGGRPAESGTPMICDDSGRNCKIPAWSQGISDDIHIA